MLGIPGPYNRAQSTSLRCAQIRDTACNKAAGRKENDSETHIGARHPSAVPNPLVFPTYK